MTDLAILDAIRHALAHAASALAIGAITIFVSSWAMHLRHACARRRHQRLYGQLSAWQRGASR